MYNLLLSFQKNSWNNGYFIIEKERYLEYTDIVIKEKFLELNDSIKSDLCSFPTVFGYESQTGGDARLGWIIEIIERQGKIRIKFEFEPTASPISMNIIEEHLWEFDIGEYEINRTHWAVKDVDLWGALTQVGISNLGNPKNSIPKISRRSVLKASSKLSNLGHAKFDSMLLEFGDSDLELFAGRHTGSLQKRSNEMGRYAVDYPSVTIIDGEEIGLAIVRYALHSNLGDEDLVTSIEKDGFIISDEELIHPEIKSNASKKQSEKIESTFQPIDSTDQTPSQVPDKSQDKSLIYRPLIQPTVFKIPETKEKSDHVGVLMPFSPEYSDVFELIKNSCNELGLQCKRADDIWENEKIIDDIIELIFSSAIIIADFSTRNPNVMYETGICHILGKTVIPIVQEKSDVPFDLQSIRFIPYLNNTQGLGELKEKLIDRLKTLTE